MLADGIHLGVLYQHEGFTISAISLPAALLSLHFEYHLPQVAGTNTPQTQDAPGEFIAYDERMTRVYIADAKSEERSALRLVLLDLKMEVAGEAADWTTTLAQAPIRSIDMLLIDWDLLPSAPNTALSKLRTACPAALVIILISHLGAREQAALSAGADAFISKGERPEGVAERLRVIAAKALSTMTPPV